MAQAGLLERPRRGIIVATPRGREVLREHPDHIDNGVLSRFREFRKRSREGAAGGGEIPAAVLPPAAADDVGTPEERIEAAFREVETALRQELLVRITVADPTFFEHLIIDLMIAMGYGGSGSGRHLGKTSDGGVDGVINEDALGLDIVYLQAKRYAPGNGIGVDKVREFAGTLDERGGSQERLRHHEPLRPAGSPVRGAQPQAFDPDRRRGTDATPRPVRRRRPDVPEDRTQKN